MLNGAGKYAFFRVFREVDVDHVQTLCCEALRLEQVRVDFVLVFALLRIRFFCFLKFASLNALFEC
jgi:hypothetical protein|eukprot:COSAG06_NODE_2114_length_7559_cov_15.641019_5_plen_66_part_00